MRTPLGKISILLGAAVHGFSIAATVDASQAHVYRQRLLQAAADTAPIVGVAVGSVRPVAPSPSTGDEFSSESEVETELVTALELDDQVTGEYAPPTGIYASC